MANCKHVLTSVFVLSFCCSVQSIQVSSQVITISRRSTRDQFQPCNDGWVQRGNSCYKFYDTPISSEEAANSCRRNKSHLVVTETLQERLFVSGFLSNRDSDSLWVAARYEQDDDTNWLWGWIWTDGPKSTIGKPVSEVVTDYDKYTDDATEKPCAKLSSEDRWKSDDCEAKLPFLCEQDPPCSEGWYGESCSTACHCSGSRPCDHETGLCPLGCQAGWTGSACNVFNQLPQATYHCLRTLEGALQANLTVNPHRRDLRIVQAVAEDGTPLSCHLDARKTRNGEWFVPLSLKNAFHEENVVISAIDAYNDKHLTVSDSNTSSPTNETTTQGISDSISADNNMTTKENTAGDRLSETTSPTEVVKRETQEGVKREGHECIASGNANNTVTWLIEFKTFDGVSTDDDVTIEVTCELDDADNMLSTEIVMDVSHTDRRMNGMVSSVVRSEVYLTDAVTGQRLDEYHTGHTLVLHLDVIGLTSNECAAPSKCVLRPVDAEKTEIVLTEENGCPAAGSPVTKWNQYRSSGDNNKLRQEFRYTTNPFPAVSLGTSQLQVECKLDVVFEATDSDGKNCLKLLTC